MSLSLTMSQSQGCEPTSKRQKVAKVGHKHFLLSNQPCRVPLGQVGFHPDNRGGQGIVPLHTHKIASDICLNGLSTRRSPPVALVVVPEKERAAWQSANRKKEENNPLLPHCSSNEEMVYASFTGTHFVHALKLIAEGDRTFMNGANGTPLRLVYGDKEWAIIQEQGVQAFIFGEGLWHDRAALLQLMADSNIDGEVLPLHNRTVYQVIKGMIIY